MMILVARLVFLGYVLLIPVNRPEQFLLEQGREHQQTGLGRGSYSTNTSRTGIWNPGMMSSAVKVSVWANTRGGALRP
jgi:hypothetical protein